MGRRSTNWPGPRALRRPHAFIWPTAPPGPGWNACSTLPEPNSAFESQQREDALALKKALLTLHHQQGLEQVLAPAEETQGRGRQRL